MANPVIAAVGAALDANGHPVTSISVLAPRYAGAAVCAITWSAWRSNTLPGLPAGVSGHDMQREADTCIILPPVTDIEAMCIEAAWMHGAWDIVRTSLGPTSGPLPPAASMIDTSHGYTTWTWRPMAVGPALRIQAAARAPDASLDRTGWRMVDVPLSALNGLTRSGTQAQAVLRLGATSAGPSAARPGGWTSRGRRGGRMTLNQHRYIDALCTRLGLPLPPDVVKMAMPRAAASALIDDLKRRIEPT